MHNIIHFYYQNKKKIWRIILIVAGIIGLIRLFDYMARNKVPSTNNYIADNTINLNENSNTIVQSNKSLVDGEQISSDTLIEAKETIESFINYCNDKEIEQAYNVLTQECKDQLYPTLEAFTENYWSKLFKQKKICIIENWTGDTYKVTITEDMLTTGKSINGSAYIEYMTIKKTGDVSQLNINNYIGKTEINKTAKERDIEINIASKDTYMDYEIYNIQISNNSDKNIMLDTLVNNDTIYLQDSNGIKYYSYNYRLQKNDMIINKGLKKNIEITFSNGYMSSRKIKNLVFSELILDYKGNNNIDNQDVYTFNVEI